LDRSISWKPYQPRVGGITPAIKHSNYRKEVIAPFSKYLGKQAGLRCRWCKSKDDLRTWNYKPDQDPDRETLTLLCGRCRGLAGESKADVNELYSIRNALWSDVVAVAEEATRVLAQCKEPWVREAIEESFIDEDLKAALLKA